MIDTYIAVFCILTIIIVTIHILWMILLNQGQGACFLFHCGPAQNFRCKFSKHASYTSAVFSIEKKEPRPAVAAIKPNHSLTISQNELELKNLKGKPSAIVKKPLQSELTTATTQQRMGRNIFPIA